ncbi:hypothetical protein EJ06DRAFT_579947 [Trichodelitschia bisporula]|uniref:Mitochondrial outer membrane transport complex Sam37/metaxin N-terminal domain-containing protein n=1 Tax=Trichodelitschia bisporula TaxID=703511 RepID=A0A6G1I308_9PEZI|nr:hypothetical protein EJ06DRAFT_579947 [Trichodelitschia bisporula]
MAFTGPEAALAALKASMSTPEQDMELQLHIWGGDGFDLPSISADCIAAMAFMAQHEAHISRVARWVVIKSYDTSISPNGAFPLLTLNGADFSCTGYFAIASFISSLRTLEPAPPYPDLPKAAAFHASTAPLLDLALYASSTNYWAATSPAYTAILPWYANYVIPPAHRAAALRRTAHLSLDPDPAPTPRLPSAATPPITPRTPSITSSLRSDPARAHAIRLTALTRTAFADLLPRLGTADPASPLPSLALGVLSLALWAPVPETWLADGVREYAGLAAWAEEEYVRVFGRKPRGPVVNAAVASAWEARERSAPPAGLAGGVGLVARRVVGGWVGDGIVRPRGYTPEELLMGRGPGVCRERIGWDVSAPAVVLGMLGVLGVAVGVAAKVVHVGGEAEVRRFSDLGEAGALLGAVMGDDGGAREKEGVVVARRER